MTFGELRTILRDDMLAESSTDYYSDDDLLGFLQRSAREIAMALTFPRVVGTTSIAGGATSFTLPSGAATAELNEVNVGGFNLTLKPYSRIVELQNLSGVKYPQHYNYDPRRDALTVYIAPAPAAAATVNFEYVENYNSDAATASTEAWSGQFEGFHEIIALRGAEKAFRASLEMDKAEQYLQQYQRQFQEFAAYLGKSDIASLGVGEAAKS